LGGKIGDCGNTAIRAGRFERSTGTARPDWNYNESTRAAGSRKRDDPDLSRIEWRGRKVYILFDANVATNHRVAAARIGFAKELAHRGAEVWLIDLPREEGVNGIDDYLGRHGAGPALELFQAARRFDPKKKLASLTFTDYGNEQAFQDLFGDDYLYNFTLQQWLHW
jgi:hypothetical protein